MVWGCLGWFGGLGLLGAWEWFGLVVVWGGGLGWVGMVGGGLRWFGVV